MPEPGMPRATGTSADLPRIKAGIHFLSFGIGVLQKWQLPHPPFKRPKHDFFLTGVSEKIHIQIPRLWSLV